MVLKQKICNKTLDLELCIFDTLYAILALLFATIVANEKILLDISDHLCKLTLLTVTKKVH